MIIVDSSAWIDILCDPRSLSAATLQRLDDDAEIVLGDLILMELLQGARDDRHAVWLERELRRYALVPIFNADVGREAARNYRTLRALGITPRSTIDVVIATFCIDGGHTLLHRDRDFAPFARHFGLQVLNVSA